MPALCLSTAIFLALAAAAANASIVSSKHNLSVTGPGQIRALTETRICVFCHTPHNGAPQTPLWNREVGSVNYRLYESTTAYTIPVQPAGPSRLCLSCHDGIIALGALLTGTVETTGEIAPGRRSYLGADLADDHPISISYVDAMVNPEIVSPPPMDPRLLFYGDFRIECPTCHDAHDDSRCSRGFDCKFLVMDNKYSALCVKCHNMNGWLGSTQAASNAIWSGILPDPWPNTDWNTVAENGCENCHLTHSAEGAERLLRFVEEERNCFPCHNGHVAAGDLETAFNAPSHHPVENTTGVHEPNEFILISGHVECADCHNLHAYNSRAAEAPFVSGSLEKVSGMTKDGNPVASGQYASYEYEVCFRCHADTGSSISYVQRVVNETNTRLEFATGNPSYHPVIGAKFFDPMEAPPSLNPPGTDPDVPENLTDSSVIYCIACHNDDGGTRGPHGSQYSPILRKNYEITYQPYAYNNFALCYRCHNEASILSDASFQKNISGLGGHSGHLAADVPCSVCHDPHGVRFEPGTGDHTHLINFDTTIVSPVPTPIFEDGGIFAGSCTLNCHLPDGSTKVHTDASYP